MNQAVRARYDYDPFGRVTKISGDRDSTFLYTGHMWHAQSGLYLTLFRAYDPELGRWISRDPLGEKDGSNTYLYVHNNPILFADPLGLFTTQDFVNFSAGFGDKLTLGGTHWLRNKMGLGDRVDECSGAYRNGGYAGIAGLILAGGAYAASEVFVVAEELAATGMESVLSSSAELGFQSEASMLEHFSVKGAQISAQLGEEYSLSQYLADANWVIRNGTYLSNANAYYAVTGVKDLIAFVGVTRAADAITTFYLRGIGDLARAFPDLFGK